MKTIIQILTLIALLAGCNSADAPDCLRTTGASSEVMFEIEPFKRIEIKGSLHVYITTDSVYTLSFTGGKNVIANISHEINDGLLKVADNNSCDWVRDYDYPTVRISTPTLVEIRQAGDGIIFSSGTLHYPALQLISEDVSGDFVISVDVEKLVVVCNDITNFTIEGRARELNAFIASGDSRFDGSSLATNNAQITHRGSNDVIVNVTNKLSGRILSTGDLIYVNRPPAIIEVEDENIGNLIDKTN